MSQSWIYAFVIFFFYFGEINLTREKTRVGAFFRGTGVLSAFKLWSEGIDVIPFTARRGRQGCIVCATYSTGFRKPELIN